MQCLLGWIFSSTLRNDENKFVYYANEILSEWDFRYNLIRKVNRR